MSQLVLSIFPGIGLLDRAFEEEGFVVVRGPDVLWGGDIHNFHPPEWKFDGVIGGPPCQCFSALANLVRANGYEPKFGNLIPEFERCIAETQPTWFLMEEIPAAPVPKVKDYSVHSFFLDNSWLPNENSYGQEQLRRRRFSFGVLDVLGQGIYDLRKHIEMAAFDLPKIAHAVTAAHSGKNHPKGGALVRYRLEEACRLQGLPEDFLSDAPFTAQGKLKAVANGVPLPMGRAVAKAVKKAIENVGCRGCR